MLALPAIPRSNLKHLPGSASATHDLATVGEKRKEVAVMRQNLQSVFQLQVAALSILIGCSQPPTQAQDTEGVQVVVNRLEVRG